MKNNNSQNNTNEISIMTVEKEGESITQEILKLPKLLTAEETRRMWVKAHHPESFKAEIDTQTQRDAKKNKYEKEEEEVKE
jgi:hypothetical protein